MQFCTSFDRLSFVFYGWFGIWPILAKGIHISKLYITPPKNGIYLSNICTTAAYRGQGLFSNWFAKLIQRRFDTLVNCIVLDVTVDNLRAEALYQKLGFRLVAEQLNHGKVPIIGIRRLHWHFPKAIQIT